MLFELRKGGRVVERVRPRPRGFEETRLGVMASERKGKDGWHEIPDGRPADGQGQAADTDGG